MESRKLQRTGGSTYAITLPKRWVTGAGLKPGDSVYVEVSEDGSLALRAKLVERGVRKRQLDVEEEPREHLLRKLIGAYIAGYDVIELRFKPEHGPAVRRVAREFARRAIGTEILEEGRGHVVLQDLLDPRELDAEKVLRRMYVSVRAMHEDALEALRTGDDVLAKDVVQRDADIDRLFWAAAKQESLDQLSGPAANRTNAAVRTYRPVAKLLERVGDHAERIAAAVPVVGGKLEKRLLRELTGASQAALASLDRAFQALMAPDVDAANRAVDEAKGVQRLVDALAHRVATHKGEELLALGAVVDSLSRTGGYAADIAEMAINHAVGREG